MNKAIKAMRYAGLTLADFRKCKTKSERYLFWMLVVSNIHF